MNREASQCQYLLYILETLSGRIAPGIQIWVITVVRAERNVQTDKYPQMDELLKLIWTFSSLCLWKGRQIQRYLGVINEGV